MPENAIYVGRPTRWGNPYKVGDIIHRGASYSGRDELIVDAKQCVNAYKIWIWAQGRIKNLVPELKGKVLACWCRTEKECHADVVLE